MGKLGIKIKRYNPNCDCGDNERLVWMACTTWLGRTRTKYLKK